MRNTSIHHNTINNMYRVMDTQYTMHKPTHKCINNTPCINQYTNTYTIHHNWVHTSQLQSVSISEYYGVKSGCLSPALQKVENYHNNYKSKYPQLNETKCLKVDKKESIIVYRRDNSEPTYSFQTICNSEWNTVTYIVLILKSIISNLTQNRFSSPKTCIYSTKNPSSEVREYHTTTKQYFLPVKQIHAYVGMAPTRLNKCNGSELLNTVVTYKLM